jgi:hypothetical protein
VVQLNGDAGYLTSYLIHYNYSRLRQFLDKQDQYSMLDARAMFRAGVRPKPRNYVLQPLREWYRRYVQLRGVLDGGHGLLLATLLGYYNLVTYRKLRALWIDQEVHE